MTDPGLRRQVDPVHSCSAVSGALRFRQGSRRVHAAHSEGSRGKADGKVAVLYSAMQRHWRSPKGGRHVQAPHPEVCDAKVDEGVHIVLYCEESHYAR